MNKTKLLSAAALSLAALSPQAARADSVTALDLVEGNAYLFLTQPPSNQLNVHRYTFSVAGEPQVFYGAFVGMLPRLFMSDGMMLAESTPRNAINELSATLVVGDYYLEALTGSSPSSFLAYGVINMHAIPEPSTMGMLLAGLSMMGGRGAYRARVGRS